MIHTPRSLHRHALALLLFAAACALVATPAHAGENTLGAGVHYWRTVDDIRDQGFGTLGVEVDLEYFDKGFGGSTTDAYSPQIYLVFGHHFYAAVGAGTIISSGLDKCPSDPF